MKLDLGDPLNPSTRSKVWLHLPLSTIGGIDTLLWNSLVDAMWRPTTEMRGRDLFNLGAVLR